MKTKSNLLLLGTLALALVFVFVLAGCAKKFDGKSLTGTTWVGEISQNLSDVGGGTVTIQVTVNFTSDTAGRTEVEITKWLGEWPEDIKALAQTAMNGMNAKFTYTYDGSAYTGELSTIGEFSINAAKKSLTFEGDGSVLKLK